MEQSKKEIRKSELIVRAIPNYQLTKIQQVIQHYLLYKIGRNN